MSLPKPEITDLTRPYWDGLHNNQLLYQHCKECENNWLPPREACPECLSPNIVWEQSCGEATVVSWVVYHKAYTDYFISKVPYDLTIVELTEGPRLLTNVVNSKAGKLLNEGLHVVLSVEIEDGVSLAKFRIPDQEDAK
jgi:uncharacterized OB-fold protein